MVGAKAAYETRGRGHRVGVAALQDSGHCHSVDPGRHCHGCLVFIFAGSLGLEKLSGPKRSTSLLQ